ncbi:hypothetical protein HanIR_Chr03g0129381 [Helianthus annuus]|nr:hypothetical protein HanIR_Chr03g0129381 [Helianthus annuus]
MSKLGTKCDIKCKPQGPSMYFWKKSKGFSMSKLGTKCDIKCKPQGPSMYFWKKKVGTKCVTSANHKDHLCTFRKLGTKFKIFENHGTIHVLYSL